MINEENIRNIVEEKLGQSGLYLTDIIVKQGNNIMIFIDGDAGVTIDDCAALSKFLESKLDRDSEDFNLQVSSAGVDQPLKFARQYIKNIGRRLQIELQDGQMITGKLLSADEQTIRIITEKTHKHKIIPDKEIEIQYNDIKKALCLISFK